MSFPADADGDVYGTNSATASHHKPSELTSPPEGKKYLYLSQLGGEL